MREGVGAVQGLVDESISSDFPGLSLWSIRCDLPAKGSARDNQHRLVELEDRVRGIAVGELRTDRIAGAYRGFARQVGLDPDIERNPLDQAAYERLVAGSFKADHVLDQALLVAMLETGVPLWALNGPTVNGWLRLTVGDDDALWVADDEDTLTPMLARPPKKVSVSRKTEAAVVFALQVEDVPATTIEEALWHVRSCLAEEH